MKNKLAVITGGSSGIGKATVEKLANEGYFCINLDIQAPKNQHKNTEFILCDVTKATDIEKASKYIMECGMSLKVLVSNAGQGIHERLDEGDPEKWNQILQLNVMGTLRIIRAIMPFMQQGHVFFMSSVAAEKPYEYGGVYAASKAAINVIAETLRLEKQPDIQVSVIQPGVVGTTFFDHVISGQQTVENIGWGAVHPDEIANLIFSILKLPPKTSVNKIVIRPSAQPL